MNSPALPIQTMTTREIAELTGKEHRNVLRDARAMLIELHGEGDLLRFERVYTDPGGRSYPMLALPFRECMVLVSGYDIQRRARIIDRWQELEARAAAPVALNLRDPKQLAGFALQLLEFNQELQTKVDAMQTTVAAHDRIARSDGASCITDTAKVLQMRPKDLFKWLRENKWIYRRPGGAGWLAYQDRILSGLLEHKVTTIDYGDGDTRTKEQVRVTRKGLTRISELLNKALQ